MMSVLMVAACYILTCEIAMTERCVHVQGWMPGQQIL